ncbi:MAG TPA: caspase family protein [Xanthobacteraceae bacterium]|jgi:uncharacterized caspase-like protein
MRRLLGCLVALCTLIPIGFVWTAKAQPEEKRIALVIGNAGYQTGALKTSANDAGLIAQTLQAAGFDVVGARDLDEEALRRALREFLSKASSSGPDTVAFIYLSGYGLQLEGENYFLPIDAKVARAADVAAQALRVSDYIRPLASLKLRASIVVLDAARRNPFTISGDPLAGGLALVEPGPNTLVAFNTAPGTISADEQGPYGAYARALSEMMREGGLSLPQVFERARLRVSDMTKGAELPWFSSHIDTAFVFFERGPDAPTPAAAAGASTEISSRSIRELPVADAYEAAVERDTLQGYQEFLAIYPDDPLARRVRAILAARREAITWQRTYAVNTPNAYWSYLRRYPHGPHSADARRRLALGAFALEPPAAFDPIDYDVTPPSPDEETYVDRPALAFDDADLGFVPPPPLPVYFLPPPPPELVVLAPPFPVVEDFVLPVPVFVPIPVWCDPPAYVVAPPDNVIFANIHNTIIVDRQTNAVTIRDRHGDTVAPERNRDEARAFHPRASEGAGRLHGAGAAHLAGLGLSASLPLSLAQRRSPVQSNGPTATALTGQHASRLPFGQPLPGMHGQPLPSLPGRSGSPAALSSTKGSDVLTPAPAHHAPSMPAARLNPGTLGQPLPGMHGQPLPPLSGRPGPAGTLLPPPRSVQTPLVNGGPARPAAPAMSRPSAPVAAFHPPSPPAAAYRAPPPSVAHTAPPPVLRPPPVMRAAPAPVFRPPAPAMHAAAPPVFHPPAPPVVRAAPPPVVRPPAPTVRPAAPPPAAVARRPPPPPGRRG